MNNLDNYYISIDKHINLAQSFTEINSLKFIIKSCRLRPYQPLNKNIQLYRHWHDEYRNSLKITKDKKIKVTYNDLSLDNDKIICTDLYQGLSIDKVIAMSKLGYFFFGKEEDSNSDCAFFTFLGIDNYLRSFMYLFDKLQVVSSLYLGLNNLKLFYDHLDIKYFCEMKNKKDYPIPCQIGKAWLSYLPFSDGFSKELSHQPEIITQYLKEKNK